MVATDNVTELLRAWRRGDADAFDRLGPLLMRELRRLASVHLRGERPSHTLSPTDLISEAYLRLAGAELEPTCRAHFFALASRAMRQILVDHARRRSAAKRGAGASPLELFQAEELAMCATDSGQRWQLLHLDRALEVLSGLSPRKARVVELHYFGGLTQDEIAQVCEVHVNTVARDLRFAEAWLRSQLGVDEAKSAAAG